MILAQMSGSEMRIAIVSAQKILQRSMANALNAQKAKSWSMKNVCQIVLMAWFAMHGANVTALLIQ
jgi:predicted Co/Zn/Cd cation transporter (cation efflux family)